MSAVGSAGRSALHRTEDAVWSALPTWLFPRVPVLGLVASDGGWLRAVPGLGLAVPVVAFLLGLVRGGWRPERQQTYGYSLTWLLVMLALALTGTAIGLLTWAGFVLGDALVFDKNPPFLFFDLSLTDRLTGIWAPRLVSYLLLASLLVAAPLGALAARGVVTGALRVSRPVRTTTAAVVGGVAAGVTAGFWTQAYPLLIRPVWTWSPSGRSPEVAGIAPVQTHPWVVGIVAALLSASMGALAEQALARRIRGRRYQPVAATPRPRSSGRQVVRAVTTALARAAAFVLLFAGLVPSWGHALLAFTILAIAFVVQSVVIARTAAARWWNAHLPASVRLIVALLLGWLVAWQIGRTAYRTQFGFTQVTAHTFAPLLYAAVAAIAVAAVLLPPLHQDPS